MRTVFPLGVTVYSPEKCYNGYTLINNYVGKEQADARIFQYQKGQAKTDSHDEENAGAASIEIIDMNGNQVHTWKQSSYSTRLFRLLKDGNLLLCEKQETNSLGYFPEGATREYDWEGNLVWECFPPVEQHGVGGTPHRLANGNTLFFYKMALPDAARMKISDPERRKLDGMLSDCIAEVTPEGKCVWNWQSHDHLDMDGWCRNDPSPNWTHFNTIQSLPENKWHDMGDRRFKPGNILVSGRSLGFIFIIEKATGEIIWRYYGDYFGGLAGQHSPHMIAKGFPGEGNILVFDNGQSPLRYDRHGGMTLVFEINPQTQKIVWMYRNDFSFFSAYGGHCERLPNGNTLITEPYGHRIFEVTMAGEIVWEYVADPRVIELVMDAQRVPYDHCLQLAKLAKVEEKAVLPPEHVSLFPKHECKRTES